MLIFGVISLPNNLTLIRCPIFSHVKNENRSKQKKVVCLYIFIIEVLSSHSSFTTPFQLIL